MKILIQHDGILPIKKYGGTERILYWNIKELVKLGHEVFLIGPKGTSVKEIGAHFILQESNDWRHQIPADIDIIHLYNGPVFEFDKPVMITIGGNGKPDEEFHENTVFVSKKHAANHSSNEYVYNGIDFDEYPLVRGYSQDLKHFMFLAKASWKVKNVSDCKRACKKNKKHLHIAGGNHYLPSRYIHSYGMVDQEGKLPIFKKVDAFLWPVLWHEPFGIAVIEAFSQGLPVFSSGYGSSPELINSDVGKICTNYEEFSRQVGMEAHNFSGEYIREYAKKNFSSKAMALGNLECYERILSGESLNKKKPITSSDFNASKLLPFE